MARSTKRIKRRPYKLKRKKSIFKSRFFWIFVLILILSGAFLYFLFLSPFFQIKEFRISGNQKITTENLQQLIEEKINKRMLFFNSKSIFLFGSKEINNSLLERFPEISQINLKRKLPDILIVEIKERMPIAVWCNGECFYIDKEGIIFERGPLELENELIIRSGIGEMKTDLGEKILDKKYIETILKIQKELKENIKMKIAEFIVLKEGRLNVKTSEGWEIYFDIDGDIAEQISNLIIVLEEKISPEVRRNLEYIDLRFENRIYFK